jgi:hypothetical protein
MSVCVCSSRSHCEMVHMATATYVFMCARQCEWHGMHLVSQVDLTSEQPVDMMMCCGGLTAGGNRGR